MKNNYSQDLSKMRKIERDTFQQSNNNVLVMDEVFVLTG